MAFHAGQRKWEENYGSEEALLEQVNRELAGEFTA
jgi:hypothetical protein